MVETIDSRPFARSISPQDEGALTSECAHREGACARISTATPGTKERRTVRRIGHRGTLQKRPGAVKPRLRVKGPLNSNVEVLVRRFARSALNRRFDPYILNTRPGFGATVPSLPDVGIALLAHGPHPPIRGSVMFLRGHEKGEFEASEAAREYVYSTIG